MTKHALLHVYCSICTKIGYYNVFRYPRITMHPNLKRFLTYLWQCLPAHCVPLASFSNQSCFILITSKIGPLETRNSYLSCPEFFSQDSRSQGQLAIPMWNWLAHNSCEGDARWNRAALIFIGLFQLRKRRGDELVRGMYSLPTKLPVANDMAPTQNSRPLLSLISGGKSRASLVSPWKRRLPEGSLSYIRNCGLTARGSAAP